MTVAFHCILPLLLLPGLGRLPAPAAELAGTSIIPHRMETAMRYRLYRLPRDPAPAACGRRKLRAESIEA